MLGQDFTFLKACAIYGTWVYSIIAFHGAIVRQTTHFSSQLQWATKVLRHLVVKLDLGASWSHFPPPSPQNNVDFSISSTGQTTAPARH